MGKVNLQQTRLSEFDDSLPSIYRYFLEDKFPRMDIASQLFSEWSTSSPVKENDSSPFQQDRYGLIFYGPPRSGKTQLACELIRRAIQGEKSKADARFISAVQWCGEASAMAKNCELNGWAHRVLRFAWRTDCEPGIVFLDDLDKVRCTPAIQSELFNLIETITANELVLIVTTNISANALSQKFDPEFGAAIVARIKEFCVPVDFGKASKAGKKPRTEGEGQ